MARVGMMLVIGAIVASMIIAMFFFIEYRQIILEAEEGEQITVGPARYTLTYEGIEEGLREINSNGTFMKVGIVAVNMKGETVMTEKKQFALLDRDNVQTRPVHGVIADSSKITAYFPLADDEFDEEYEYRVMIRPTKEQASLDIGFVCITNCR